MSNDAELKRILSNWAMKVVETAQRNLGATQTVIEHTKDGPKSRKRRRVASGNLKDNLNFFITKGSGNIKVKFGAKGSAKQYADVIEEGRRPNSPPPPTYAIEKWMEEKNIRLRAGGVFVKETEKGRRAAAYLIARKIGKYGITGIHYYKEAVEQHLPELNKDMKVYVEMNLKLT